MAKAPYREKPADIHAGNVALLKDRIKNKNLAGTYVFYGDEEYTKNHYYSLMCGEAGNRMLNVKTVYEGEFELSDFMESYDTDAAETADMFSMEENTQDGEEQNGGFRVIRLVKPDLSSLSKADADFLADALSDSENKNAVVFWFYSGDDPDLSKGVYKRICENALVVNFKREPVGSAVLITWILRHFSRAKLNVERSVAVYLCSTVGNDMTMLKNEIDKCIDWLYYNKRDNLTNADIDFICIKSAEAQIFDVSNFAFRGNFIKAASALSVLRSKNHDPFSVFATLSNKASELEMIELCGKNAVNPAEMSKKTGIHEYAVKMDMEILRLREFSGTNVSDSFAKRCVKLCSEYEDKLKTSGADGYTVLTELVCRIAFAGRGN